MTELEKAINAFLAKPEADLDYNQAVELYTQHPKHRRNVAKNLEQRYQWGVMHAKVIYELEVLIGAKPTQRKAKLNSRPANVVKTATFAVKVKREAPKDYEYAVKFQDLPEELKKLVIEKGQVYNHLDASKKKLALLGENNDVKTVAKRKNLMQTMQQDVDRIKAIHALVSKYRLPEPTEPINDENAEQLDPNLEALRDQITALQNSHANTVTDAPEPDGDTPEGTEEPSELEKELDTKFKYIEMGYYQRKDLQKKLRTALIKQNKSAVEASKEKTRLDNAAKAKQTQAMLDILNAYFEETPAPEKE